MTADRARFPPRLPAPGQFDAERLAKIQQIEQWHFWFLGRQHLLDRAWAEHVPPAPGRILDVGCGTGHWSRRLATRGYDVVALDARPEGLASLRQHAPSIHAVQAGAAQLPVAPSSFDAVLLLDVLEHTDDRVLLAEIARVLRPRGRLVITVPALPALWSYRDRAAGHHRRYTKTTLIQALREQGFRVRAIRYYQCLLLPLVVASRLFGRRGPALRDAEERPGPLLNSTLAAVNRLEARLGTLVPWPVGSSLAAFCEKP